MLSTSHHYDLKASEHPIDKVTVFKSSNAEIVRVIALDLKTGNNQISISGLSSHINTESFRVSGLGNAQLLDVVCTVDTTAAEDEDEDIRKGFRNVQDLQAEKAIHQQEIDLLVQYGNAMTGSSVSSQQAGTFYENLVAKKLELSKTLRKLDDQINSWETFIKATKKPMKGWSKGRVSIMILAHKSSPVQLTLSYLVGQTWWRPIYDLHASSTDGKPLSSVWLHYRVHLSQRTGEHWNNTSIVLSTTATDALNAGIPEPKSHRITAKLAPDSPSSDSSASFVQRSRMMIVADEGAASFLRGSDESDSPLFEAIASLEKTPLSVMYTVAGKFSLPSDGETHKVSVVQLPFDAVISHVTVPRQEALAYLQCEVKNTTDYHLLPGPVSVFMNDGYVSKTSIPNINTGDVFRCTLGVDTSVRVTYNLSSTSEFSKASSFVEQYKTTTYTSTTKIHNRHSGDYAISINEKSSVPIVSQDDKRIKMFLEEPAGLAESDDGVEVDLQRPDGFKVKWSSGEDRDEGGKELGKFVWIGSADSGQEVTLVSRWVVKAPVEVGWVEQSSM